MRFDGILQNLPPIACMYFDPIELAIVARNYNIVNALS